MRKGFIAFLSLLLIATLTFSMRTVYGHTWNQEHNGEAALVYAGYGVTEKVADYIRPGTLKLGGVCGLLVPGWLITEGRMDVYGFATASGQVTGWISWWQKGTLAASGFKWIEIKFQALDINEDDLTEKVVLFVNATSPNPNWEDFGTQYTEDMNIYLTEGHLYKFSLYVLVEVKGGGPWTAVADFGGLLGGFWRDSRIEWRYITVPNTTPVDIWPDVLNAAELPNPVPGHKDGLVTGLDFAWVALPKYIFTRRGEMKPWPDPPGAWGPHCDVNFDRKIGVGDLMEIGANYGEPWPPPGGGSSQSYAYFETSFANVSVYPAMVVAALGKNFTVNITVSNVTDLYGWEFWMSFNSTILTAVNVTEGPFLKAAGDTFWARPKINNTAGIIAAGAMLDPPPSQGAAGNGTIATLTFYVQSDGATSLNFSDTELNTVIGGDVLPMNHTANNGYVSTTIQAAVDQADTKDTVYVTEGTYHEHVTINKSLTLVGENRDTTIIDGNGTETVVNVTASQVSISGFTIQNGQFGIYQFVGCINQTTTIRPNARGTYTEWPIVYPSGYKHWNVMSDQSDGTYVKTSDSNINWYRDTFNIPSISLPPEASISSVKVYMRVRSVSSSYRASFKTMLRIYSTDYYGPEIEPPNTFSQYYTEYTTNPNTGNAWTVDEINAMEIGVYGRSNREFIPKTGKWVYRQGYASESWAVIEYRVAGMDACMISGNTISNNFYGVKLEYSSNNTISANNIINNEVGIVLYKSPSNVIYHNNFINNTDQVYTSQSVNTWDNGTEGNHWSDYTGKDENGDGIGDAPYVINGQNKDNYPLMQPWSP